MEHPKLRRLALVCLLLFCLAGCGGRRAPGDPGLREPNPAHSLAEGPPASSSADPAPGGTPSGQVADQAMTLSLYHGARTGVYTGQVDAAGLPSGEGSFVYTGSDGLLYSYTGGWAAGRREGFGTLTISTGEVQSGIYLDDRRCGPGETLYPSGDRYVGGFLDGKRDGEGVYYYADGTVKYRGGYRAGHREGDGTLYDREGNRVYEGQFAGDDPTGNGTWF